MSFAVGGGILAMLLQGIVFVLVVYVAVKVLGLLFRGLGCLFRGIGTGVAAVFRGVGGVFGRVFGFVRDELTDTFAAAGSALSMALYVVLIMLNSMTGRVRTAGFYSRAMENELFRFGRSVYRVGFGNLARAIGLRVGFEETVFGDGPVARAPATRAPYRPRRFDGSTDFDGYEVVGSLPTGGSGAQLFVAKPAAAKRAAFAQAGHAGVDRVVIKAMSLHDGSSLPQIVRERSALESARRVGLVLDHQLDDDRFFYVMPYVPGEDLNRVTERMHARCGERGLDDRCLHQALGYTADLLETLERFHGNGLWHKDVKPSNVIVAKDRAHLVDLGLLTPLASGMTLTTHGTEYFRDPELVRLAMKGVKVHEVPGAKFDVYGTGAVLYSLVEGSFPAHGGLSRVSRRCPDAVQWIVRRAMSDLHNRYASAGDMARDVRAVMDAKDPFALKPVDLPSMKRDGAKAVALESPPEPVAAAAAPAAATPRRRGGFAALMKVACTLLVIAMSGCVAAAVFLAGSRVDRPIEIEAGARGARFALGGFEIAAGEDGASLAAGRLKAEAGPDGLTVRTRRESDHGHRHALPGELSVLATSASGPATGAILVVDDLPAVTDADTRARVDAALAALRATRFEVRGLAGDDAIDMLAAARNAVGLSDPDDPDAAARLAALLSGELSPVDAVLWIGRDGDGSGVRALLVRRDDVATDGVLDALRGEPLASASPRSGRGGYE